MFTPFTGRHVGSMQGSVILYGLLRRICQLWDKAHTSNLENCLVNLSSTISQFFDFIRCIVFDCIVYCVTVHTLCQCIRNGEVTKLRIKILGMQNGGLCERKVMNQT